MRFRKIIDFIPEIIKIHRPNRGILSVGKIQVFLNIKADGVL